MNREHGEASSMLFESCGIKAIKRGMMSACKDLGYPKEVRDRIKSAESTIELSNIMAHARRKYL